MLDALRRIMSVGLLFRLWRRALTWLGDLQCAFSPPRIKAAHLWQLLALVQPGDVILRRYTWYLDSYLIPGTYSHSMIVVDPHTVMHATSEGVRKEDIIDAVKDCDGFCLMRPRYEEGNATLAVGYAEGMEGQLYDWLFDATDMGYFYCHELSYYALQAGGLCPDLNGRRYVTADDIASVCDRILTCP